MLAQGGICVLRDETDMMRILRTRCGAGHYENRKESVDIMIRSSRDVINNLLKLGVGFDKNPDGSLNIQRRARIRSRVSVSMRTSREKRSRRPCRRV